MNIGVDIVEVSQIEKIKNLEHFIEKYFSHSEIVYIQTKANKMQTIAGLYAAKEAFLKATEIGIGKISLKDIIVEHKEETGAPYITITPLIKATLEKYGYQKVDVSIAHSGNYSVSICQLG